MSQSSCPRPTCHDACSLQREPSTLAPSCQARSTQISIPASAHLSTLSLVASSALACPWPPVSSQYPKQRMPQDTPILLCPGPLTAKARNLCSQPPMTHLLLSTPPALLSAPHPGSTPTNVLPRPRPATSSVFFHCPCQACPSWGSPAFPSESQPPSPWLFHVQARCPDPLKLPDLFSFFKKLCPFLRLLFLPMGQR